MNAQVIEYLKTLLIQHSEPKLVAKRLGYAGAVFAIYCADNWYYRSLANPVLNPRYFAEGSSEEIDRAPCQILTGYDVVVRRMTYEALSFRPVSCPMSWPVLWWWDTSMTGNKKQRSTSEYLDSLLDTSNTSLTARIYRRLFQSDLSGRMSPQERDLPENRPVRSCLTPQEAHQSAAKNRPGAVADGGGGSKGARSKLAFMVLEPQRNGKGETSAPLLQSLLDAATEQSMIKCTSNPRTTTNRSLASVCENDTNFLLAPYLRVMLSAIALFPLQQSLRVAQLGVAGGSLPMFVQRHLGHRVLNLDLVDIEPATFEVAQRSMGLTSLSLSKIFTFHPMDGQLFLATSPPNSIDVLFVDMFVGAEVPAFLHEETFIRNCRRSLTSSGVVAINLPRSNARMVQLFRDVFGPKHVFVAKCRDSTNTVVFGLRGETTMDGRHFAAKAAHFSVANKLPYDLSAGLPFSWQFV